MTKWTGGLLTALLILAGGTTGLIADDGDEWKVKWSNGFKVDSPDKKFKLKFGGRIQADWSFVDQDGANEAFYGAIDDGNEFRRARLFFSGTIYEKVEFKAQYDFADDAAEFKDVYIGIKDTPIGNLRVGHFKEPFSLEELTSSKYVSFLERSLSNMFSPGRNTGIMLYDNRGDMLNWAVGAFRDADDFGDTSDGGSGKLNLTGRIAGRPLYEDEGKQLIHVGLSVTQTDLGSDDFRYRVRPGAHLSERFIDTGSFIADDALIWDVEGAIVWNRFWGMLEYVSADVSGSDPLVFTSGDPSFDAGTVHVGFFLTHDHRRYRTSTGTFDRLKPSENYGQGGKGAWELALRYSMADLGDALVNDPEGGELETVTFAVNWYLNPATRVMFNYIMAESEIDMVDTGSADFVTLRFQVDF